MPSHAGEYNYRIRIQQANYTKQPGGQRTITGYDEVALAWARIEQVGGDEAFGSDQRSQSQRTTFIIRYITGIIPKMFISHRGQLYDIKTVEEIERRTELRMVCEVFEAKT